MRGQILERFGWKYEYLLEGIAWIDVHLMMVDAPYYEPAKTDDKNNPPAGKAPVKEPKTDAEKADALNKFLMD